MDVVVVMHAVVGVDVDVVDDFVVVAVVDVVDDGDVGVDVDVVVVAQPVKSAWCCVGVFLLTHNAHNRYTVLNIMNLSTFWYYYLCTRLYSLLRSLLCRDSPCDRVEYTDKSK